MKGIQKLFVILTVLVLFSEIKSKNVSTKVSDADDQSSENTFHYDDFENGRDLMLGKSPHTNAKGHVDKTKNRINKTSSLKSGIQDDVSFVNGDVDYLNENSNTDIALPDEGLVEFEDGNKNNSNKKNDDSVDPQSNSTSKDNNKGLDVDIATDSDEKDETWDDEDEKELLELEQDDSLSKKQKPKMSDYNDDDGGGGGGGGGGDDDDDDDDNDDDDDEDDSDEVLVNSDLIDKSRFGSDSRSKTNGPTIESHQNQKMDAVTKTENLLQKQDIKQMADDFLETGLLENGPTNNISLVSPWSVEYVSSDGKLWIGIGMGIGACLTMAAIIGSCMLFAKKRRGCGKWNKLAEFSFNAFAKDEKPIYIKLSQLHGKRQNNGPNYVITVLDESNFSVDSSWSSEEELFEISDILKRSDRSKDKSYFKTSTPLKDKSFRT